MPQSLTPSSFTSSSSALSRRTLVAALCMAGVGVATNTAWAAKAQPKTAEASAFDSETFNNASDTPLLRSGSAGAAVARAQILLDRAWFSCGEIDGRFAANMQRMVKAYQTASGLKVTGTVTAETWTALRKDSEPLLTSYTVTEKDTAGPFEKTPVAMEERAKMKALVFESVEEALAEKFHTSIGYLKQLNKGGFAAGKEITVPNVSVSVAPKSASSIEIDKSSRVLYVLDSKGLLVAGFPISIGNEKDDPLPIGMLAIKNEVKNPSFTYNPAILKNAPKDSPKVDVAPGPNNPVGSIWLGLTKPHWGIHGTPNPSKVGHSETNGCIHMTNWDAERLSTLAKAGFKVNVKS